MQFDKQINDKSTVTEDNVDNLPFQKFAIRLKTITFEFIVRKFKMDAIWKHYLNIQE